MDCWSCGDRWHTVDDDDGTKTPMIYNNKTPSQLVKESPFNPVVIIYYANGKKKKIGPGKERDDDE